MTVKEVRSKSELDSLIGDGNPVILHFWASWCEASKHMDQVFSHLSTDFPHARFLRLHGNEYGKEDGRICITMHLMKKILGITNELSQALQRKDQDIVNAMSLVDSVKHRLHTLRENECDAFLKDVGDFCAKHSINVPNMDDIIPNRLRLLPGEVEAEEQPEISEAYSVSAVPFFVFFKDGKAVDTLEGADPSSLANKVAKVAGSITPGEAAAPASLGMAAGPTIIETIKELAKENGASQQISQIHSSSSDKLTERLQQLVNAQPIMLFMKGSPNSPQCGFSQKVVEILKKEKVKFGSFDIFTDNEVREGLKKFSNWPTFPQLYCKGELLGGCDIAISMHESGELGEVFKENGIEILDSDEGKPTQGKGGIADSSGLSELTNSRLKNLINSSPVMLFMKGNPNEPRCGFSRKVVDILKQENVKFDSFDILTDDEVRQGLKVYSNWSSYPQLYIKGELIGGSDIVLEMQKSGELKKVLSEEGILSGESLEDRMKKLVNSSPVMLFMKGTPDSPKCGFSSKVVSVLKQEGVEFGSFDILTNDEVRQGLKTFSNWPTFPQLYYKGELVGGCDIVLELHGNGELKETLSE